MSREAQRIRGWPSLMGFRSKLVCLTLGFMLATLSCGGLSITVRTGTPTTAFAPTDTPPIRTSAPTSTAIDIPTSTVAPTEPVAPSRTPEPTSTPIDVPTEMPLSNTPTLPAAQPAPGVFTWAVIVDLDSEPVTREQAQELVNQASAILTELTGASYSMIDFVESTSPGNVGDLAHDYIQSHTSSLPNGIIIFSYGDDDLARTYGGYAYSVNGPPGFRNTFKSPVVGDNRVYISVQHWSHRYAGCGYGSTTAEAPTRNTSFNGECSNRNGVPCVEKNGYSMCSTAVDDLYASSRTYLAASIIIHETMHLFGHEGAMDHFGTEACSARMVAEASDRPYNADTFDSAQFDYYNGMCPYVYDNFVRAYQP